MKTLLRRILTTGLLTGVLMAAALIPLQAQPVGAAAVNTKNALSDGVQGAGGGAPNDTALKKNLKNIVNILLFILGAIAVIMIVVGGIKYTTSNGDSSAITSAKNTILYSVIGLIVALLAYAIVNFVINNFVV